MELCAKLQNRRQFQHKTSDAKSPTTLTERHVRNRRCKALLQNSNGNVRAQKRDRDVSPRRTQGRLNKKHLSTCKFFAYWDENIALVAALTTVSLRRHRLVGNTSGN
jgi:hypothetical protein